MGKTSFSWFSLFSEPPKTSPQEKKNFSPLFRTSPRKTALSLQNPGHISLLRWEKVAAAG